VVLFVLIVLFCKQDKLTSTLTESLSTRIDIGLIPHINNLEPLEFLKRFFGDVRLHAYIVNKTKLHTGGNKVHICVAVCVVLQRVCSPRRLQDKKQYLLIVPFDGKM